MQTDYSQNPGGGSPISPDNAAAINSQTGSNIPIPSPTTPTFVQNGNQFTNTKFADPATLTSGSQQTTQPTIPTSILTGTKPLNIPQVPNNGKDPASKAISNVTALNANQQALLNTADTAEQNAQNNYDQSKNDVSSLINEYLGKGQDQLNLEEQAGIPQLRTQSNQLTQQYLAAQATYNQQYNDIMNRPGSTAEQKSQEIDALQLQHGFNLTNIGIRQSIAQNDYNNAQTLVDHQIDIKYSPIKDAIDYGMQFLAQNKDILTQQEQNSFQANLAVQNQMYTQGQYYDQLNASASMDLLKTATSNGATPDIIKKMGDLIASGASPADVAGASGGFAINGNYPMTWNPKSGQLEPYNQATGTFKDGTPIPVNTQSYNLTDPNSGKTTTASDGTTYNWGTYNNDPQYGMKVSESTSTITDKVGQITSATIAQQAISTIAPTSNLTGSMIMSAAKNAGVDPTVLMGHLNQESMLGSSNVAKEDNNYGGLTMSSPDQTTFMGVPITQGTARPGTEGGNYMKFATPQDGLKAQALFDATKKAQPLPTNIGQIPTITGKMAFANQVKASMPSTISPAVTILDQTGDAVIDKSMLVDATGAPSTYALNQAASYEQMGFKVLGHDDVLALRDANAILANVNNVDGAWQKIAPENLAGRVGQSIENPINETLQNGYGQNIIAYNALKLGAIGTINSIIDSKRVSGLTTQLTDEALPVVTSVSKGGGIMGAITGGLAGAGTGAGVGAGTGLLGAGVGAVPGGIIGGIGGAIVGAVTGAIGGATVLATGDTLQTGQTKLDALRKDANITIKNILNNSSGAPLSTDFVRIQTPDGRIGTISNESLPQALKLGAKQI